MHLDASHKDLGLLFPGCEVGLCFIPVHGLLEGSVLTLHNLECNYSSNAGDHRYENGMGKSRGMGAVVEVLEEEGEGLLEIDGGVEIG